VQSLLTPISHYSLPAKLAVFIALVVATHLLVILVRRMAAHFLDSHSGRRYQKLKSISTLATSVVVFTLYFLAIGLVLREFGVSLTAYLASASVVGLAIGFGSQGIVQDVVTGLSLIFSDLVDVGDLVEISAQTGVVRAITMRFVELENAMGAAVFIPNRTINNIVNYPRGYVRCIVDVTLRGDEEQRQRVEATALTLMQTVHQQFPAILITPPSSEGRIKLASGKEILRLKFRIWPNRGVPIETAFNQELVATLQRDDPDYKTWMVAISYEVEERKRRSATGWPWRQASR
jgi:moderate conductance mechanosensitive channel